MVSVKVQGSPVGARPRSAALPGRTLGPFFAMRWFLVIRCLDCRQLGRRSPCLSCAARRKAWRNSESARCAAVVAAHRAEFGDWCPGWGVPPHPSDDLTADHVVAGSALGRLAVLCRSCNARKGNRASA